MGCTKNISVVFLSLLIGAAFGQELWDLGAPADWLSAGPIYVNGPYNTYNGVPYFSNTPYAFSEPYYTPPFNGSGPFYYPYFGGSFFTDYAVPYGYYPGYYPGFYGYGGNFTPPAGYDTFRLTTPFAYQPLPYLYPNWGSTLNYAQTSSSFRVYTSQGWTTI